MAAPSVPHFTRQRADIEYNEQQREVRLNDATPTAVAQAAAPLRRARQLRPLIESAASAIEEGRQVTPEVQAALHGAKLFRLYLPRTYGGEEVEPATFVA